MLACPLFRITHICNSVSGHFNEQLATKDDVFLRVGCCIGVKAHWVEEWLPPDLVKRTFPLNKINYYNFITTIDNANTNSTMEFKRVKD